MKIVHLSYAVVNHYTSPEEWLTKIDFFTGILQQQAHHHHIASVHCIAYDGTLEKENVHYHFINVRTLGRMLPLQINRYVKNLEPDVVIVHGLIFPQNVWLLRRQLNSKAKIFLQHHAEKPLRRLKKIFQRRIDKDVDGYFFSSVDLAKLWIDSGQIKERSKVHEIMEVSSPFVMMDKNVARAKINMYQGLNYLWVGRLDDNKDPITLVNAFVDFLYKAPEARLYIVFASGHLLPTLKLLVRDFNERIFLVGKIDHQDLVYWYNAVDFIISTSHYEGSGVAVCEAMSCGCIPILSDIPSFRMMTANGDCGLLFDSGNPLHLLRTLEKSKNLEFDLERKKVLDQFKATLSYEAIAKKINAIIEMDN